MEISISQNSDGAAYGRLLQKKYGKQKNYPYFLQDLQSALEFSKLYQQVTFITARNGEEVLGHLALIIDLDLQTGEAFFGFFDVEENLNTFTDMWRALCKEATSKNIKILKGPINATAWHQYRVLSQTDGSDFFKTELFSEPYYYDFFRTLNPFKEISYYSASRESYDFLIEATRNGHTKALQNGFTIESAETIDAARLEEILTISKPVFQDNWAYTDLTFENFLALYSAQKLTNNVNTIYFLKKGNQTIGYLSSLIEDPETLILKTIAVLPEFHRQGLGNALVHRAHLDAEKKGYKKIIYALIREDNTIKNFPREDTTIFRNYSTFEFKL